MKDYLKRGNKSNIRPNINESHKKALLLEEFFNGQKELNNILFRYKTGQL